MLTAETFDAFLEENKFAVVEFYAPWCGKYCTAVYLHYLQVHDTQKSVLLMVLYIHTEHLIGPLYTVQYSIVQNIGGWGGGGLVAHPVEQKT